MKNPGWANNRGSPPYISRNSSYQIPRSSNAPTAMILKTKTACGDDDDSPSNTGLCSDFYVLKWVPTLRTLEEIRADIEALEKESEGLLGQILVDTKSRE